jgi:signal transduction histidine kinase
MPTSENPVNILMVDDEPANLLALEAVLGGLGHNLVKARSGEEALRCLIRLDFAVILLDVLMPGMGGFETAALIRQKDRSRHTPIIFLTAVGKTEAEMFEGYAVGAIDYLFKPFRPEILRSKVSVLVDLYLKTLQVHRLNEELSHRALELESVNLMLRNENETRKRAEEGLRRSEEELKELNASLEAQVLERTAAVEERSRQLLRSNEELQQFAYVASHDLQEPLRTIISYLQLLEMRYSDHFNVESREFMDFVVKAAKHMRDLILGLLEYSRVSSQRKPFQRVDCGSVLAMVLENLKTSLSEKGAVVEHQALPEVYGDPLLLELLFQNLIGNALKFCANRAPRVEVGAERKEGEWLFRVRDNGIGIDPQYFERIFVIFQRLHSREDYPGTGLGLAVCKKTVERHGGRIWCESEVNKGSCFYFTIPFTQEFPHSSALMASSQEK